MLRRRPINSNWRNSGNRGSRPGRAASQHLRRESWVPLAGASGRAGALFSSCASGVRVSPNPLQATPTRARPRPAPRRRPWLGPSLTPRLRPLSSRPGLQLPITDRLALGLGLPRQGFQLRFASGVNRAPGEVSGAASLGVNHSQASPLRPRPRPQIAKHLLAPPHSWPSPVPTSAPAA